MQPLIVVIEKPGPEDKPNPQYLDEAYMGQPRKTVQFRLRVAEGPYAGDPADPEGHPPGKMWAKFGFTLGKRKNGQPSQLREFVIAARPDLVAGKSEDDADKALHDFDLDELSEHEEAVIVIGKYDADDAEKSYLKPVAISTAPPDVKRRLASGTAPAPPAAPAASSNGYQFNADNTLRWKPGMTTWEPVPTVAAPPPLPESAGPPPLPVGPPPLPGADRVTF